MELLNQIWTLFKKELILEWRQKYAISGILLYVFSTVFIIYTVFIQVEPRVWNTLFWIVMLFAAVNAVTKSFIQESGNRQLYYYQITDPLAVLLSKILYNTGLLLVIGMISFLAFSVLAGNPVRNYSLFIIAIFLGSLGFSITFTFIAAIAAKANNNATLMAILSFPLILPIILTLLKISAQALGLIQDSSVNTDILILIGINAMLIGLGLILFPFLWRD